MSWHITACFKRDRFERSAVRMVWMFLYAEITMGLGFSYRTALVYHHQNDLVLLVLESCVRVLINRAISGRVTHSQKHCTL